MKNLLPKVGVMGGTFDPIHLGHLATAESVREIFQLDKILFIPAARPPHKVDNNVTAEVHRLMMTYLATKSNENFQVSLMEILRDGLSYTLETVDELHKKLGAETELFFIIGADSLRDLPKWYQARELVSKCHFIATTRPNVRVNFSEVKNFFGKEGAKKIHKVTTPGIEISSTEIRRRVKEGLSIKYLVPEVVENYIVQENLYKAC
ncbi:MAG: nicotinate-nucleotide adenylyltransferase [Selenomonadaceae bacterium]|nr:nicotinate-nucleotide adenylyltransferase [Selenomonadaceae bacterium]MBQ7629425.1 nicotinate-nucleotide adenylyltransferase [Selenomonadaceae bacterium]